MVLMGLASAPIAVTRETWHSRNERLFYPLESSCLGLTTQARQRGSEERGLVKAVCLRWFLLRSSA